MHNLSDNFEGDGIERIKTLNYYNFFLETDAKKVGGKKVATEKNHILYGVSSIWNCN